MPPRSRVNASRRQSRRRKEPVVKNITTYVGVDAHKKDLFVAMLIGDQTTAVTWQVLNEPNAVRQLVRRLEREAPASWYSCRGRSDGAVFNGLAETGGEGMGCPSGRRRD